MNRATMDLRAQKSRPVQLEERDFNIETDHGNNVNIPGSDLLPLQTFSSGNQFSESTAAYFSWPASRVTDAAEDRAQYFGNLQKGVLPEILGQRPTGLQASTLLELMTIRAFHSRHLRLLSLGTAIGFRIRKGVLTDIPAILVFVARKVHKQWLSTAHCLPTALEGPGGVWCDVDVVEFAYYGAPSATPKEQLYTELVDAFGGSDPCIGSGSQVASQETYGTLGAIVKSRTGKRQVGFLTNRHVAVDLDYPSQKMFHPLPPSLGPGVYLGAVERATSFITDDLWYGIFAGTNPETFVRADGAFIPFAEDFDVGNVTTMVKGVGEIGDVHVIDLQSPVNSLVGRRVVKVGRSSGLTSGTIMAYSLEYNDEKGICLFTDFLVVGENQQTFDLEGDSGSLILLTHDPERDRGEKPRPVGIIWGGTANRGRLKLKIGQPPVNWTSGVDLGRLLDMLELDLITSAQGLQDALLEHINSSALVIRDSTLEGCSPPELIDPTPKDRLSVEENNLEPVITPNINLQVSADTNDDPHCELITRFSNREVSAEGATSVEEHQFIPRSSFKSNPSNDKREKADDVGCLSMFKNFDSEENIHVSLQLGEPRNKRRKQFD